MGFFDHHSAQEYYRKDELMAETIHRMEQFQEYHCLRSPAPANAVRPAFLRDAPEQYLKWLSHCDGGLLFDTVLLSIREYDPELDLEFDQLAQENTADIRGELGLPPAFYIIGYRSYGDPICMREKDLHIYLWDCEAQAFDTIWGTFHDFLSDEVDTAIELIADGSLEPIPLKLAGDC